MISQMLIEKLNVKGLQDDSRLVKAGDLFFAMPVENFEIFAKNAIVQGAVAVVSESPAPEGLASKWIQVSSVKDARLEAAKLFYKNPFEHIAVHAVTGTNGKTTSAFLMNEMLCAAGYKVALLGTIINKIGDKKTKATLTTPGLLELYAIAHKAVKEGCTHLVMEASSHSLYQGRVEGIEFSSALFSNLTQDHLDYHKTMDAYFEAKKLLFTKYLAHSGIAVINVDSDYGEKLWASIEGKKIAVSRLQKNADYASQNLQITEDGLKFFIPQISSEIFETPLCGEFNADNLLLVMSWAKEVGIPEKAIREALVKIRVPGRFEKVWNKNGRHIVVDYAHTPDALERVLKTARELCRRKLSVIFGCGGDRDKTKRPIMGHIAEVNADKAWLTSDNPRTENPSEIIKDVLAGMQLENFEVIENRSEAIQKACAELNEGDWLVIAGKGHEDYQIIGKTKIHFDDREEAVRAMEKC